MGRILFFSKVFKLIYEELHITTGDHFNLPGHSLAHMKVTILEMARNSNPDYRRERENYFINKFNTFYEGMNKEI